MVSMATKLKIKPKIVRQAKLSVIMPAFNEQSHLKDNVLLTVKVLDQLDLNYEIVIVSDGSEDDTFKKAQSLDKSIDNIKAVGYKDNVGKGYAIKHGFNYSNSDYVAFLDSDLDLHPEHLKDLFDYLRDHDADIVIGSKRHPQSQLNYPLRRKIISNTYYLMIKILFGFPFKDTQTGIKLFKHSALSNIFPKMQVHKYAFDLELLAFAHYHGYKIVEVPVNLDFQRPIGRIKLKDIYHVFMDTLGVFYRLKVKRERIS